MSAQLTNKYKYLLGKGVIDLSSNTFKGVLMISGYNFNPVAHAAYADISAYEHTTSYGYTSGGVTLTGGTYTQDDSNLYAVRTFSNPQWTASGGALKAVGMAIIDTTVTSPVVSPIVGYIDFEEEKSTQDTGVFSVTNVAIRVR